MAWGKKKQEETGPAYVKSDLSLFDKSFIPDLNRAIEQGQFKMVQCTNDGGLNDFPAHIRLDKVSLTYSRQKNETFITLDPPEDCDNSRGVNREYIKFWKLSAAGFISRDVKKNALDKYYILTFNSAKGIHRALIRSMYSEVNSEMTSEEYDDMMLRFKCNNILNIVINDVDYSILKIIPFNGNWIMRQNLYDDSFLMGSAQEPEEPEEELIITTDNNEQYELF